ncbi:hypothetical protein B0H14DRAFT_1490606 [Mycena olivaceomarginata]|nr:hypothetical protein B0H14DRAFT_1490606 [Mycena olivaceomarginata]
MPVVDDRDRAEDGDEELPTPVPWRSELLAPRTLFALSVNVHVSALSAYHESEEGEEPQMPVPELYGSHEREVTPTPYTRWEEEREREREGEGKQLGGKRQAVTSRVVRHLLGISPATSRTAVCFLLPLSRNTVSILARSLARHDSSRSFSLNFSFSLCVSVSPKSNLS